MPDQAFERDLLKAFPDLASELRTRKGRFSLNAFWFRLRAERLFAQPRWTRQLACSWIAYRTTADIGRSTRQGIFYDKSMVDRDPDRSLVEAVAKGWLLEFTDECGEVWYESKTVRAVFPEPTSAALPRKIMPPMSEAAARNLLPPFVSATRERYRQDDRKFSIDGVHKEAEDHFQKTIPRDLFRTICRKGNLTGPRGRPKKPQKGSAA